MKHGVMRRGSLDCLGNELSVHPWIWTPGKPLECLHFPQSPNIGGTCAGMVVILVMVLFVLECTQIYWSSSI